MKQKKTMFKFYCIVERPVEALRSNNADIVQTFDKNTTRLHPIDFSETFVEPITELELFLKGEVVVGHDTSTYYFSLTNFYKEKV